MENPLKRFSMLAALVALLMISLLAVAGPAPAATVQDRDYVMKVLVRGAPLHQANGIWADAHGRLYVGTVAGGEIAVLDARTGHVLDRYTRAEGFGSADDVTMGPDGSLYWTNLLEGEVGRLEPDGTITRQPVAPGVNPITFSADGRLFVGQAIVVGDALWELDPALKADPKLVWQGSNVPPYPDQLNGFDFGPDGMLYAPQPYQGRVVRFDLSATPVEPQEIASGLEFPTAVKFDSQGRLYAVQSSDQGEVVSIDVTTGHTMVIATVPTGRSGLDNLAFDPCDRLYVTGGGDGSVWQILPSRRARNLSRGGVNTPTGVAAIPGRRCHVAASLYVADVFSLWKFDARTGRAKDVQWISFEGSGELTMPFTVAPCGRRLVLSSFFTNSVQIWDPLSATSVAVWYDLPVPLNAIRFQCDFVVATIGDGGKVVRQDSGGARTTIADGLYVPSGLAATRDDLWVADWASGIVWQVVENGAVLSPLRPVTFGLDGPEGLAVDRDGSLLVIEEGAARLTRIDPATGGTSTVASGLRMGLPPSPSFVPFGYLSGVAVDARGNIYVAADDGGLIYRLKRIPGR